MIDVLLVDDHKQMLEELRDLVNGEADMEVVAVAESGAEAIELVNSFHPSVVVMDVIMPEMNGIEATRKIRQQTPESTVMAMSNHADSEFVAEMLNAGSRGYVLKEAAGEELIAAIREVHRGGTYVGRELPEV